MSYSDDVARALDEDARATPRTNQAVKPTVCKTCDGDRFVVVRLRSPEQTVWQAEHNIRPPRDQFYEEVAPCPDCHRIEIEWWTHNGRKFRVMDPAAVREALTL